MINHSQSSYSPKSESVGDRRRRYLFELYSNNLNFVKQEQRVHIEPDEDEGFICPICLKFFSREGLSKDYDDHLTLEDVPPKSLGGRVLTLTCKICNNELGSKLESHLFHKLTMDDFLAGFFDTSVDARFRPHQGIDLTAKVFYRKPGIIDIRYYNERSNPDDIAMLHELEATGNISDFKLVLYGKYKYNRPEIALLRIAYLWAFSFFGYGFLMNPNLNNIRYQILHPEEIILPHWGIFQIDFPDTALGVNLITEPKELYSFLVVFELVTTHRKIRYGVILPGPSKPGLNIYEWLIENEVNNDSSFTLKACPIPKANYVSDPKLSFDSLILWNKLQTQA